VTFHSRLMALIYLVMRKLLMFLLVSSATALLVVSRILHVHQKLTSCPGPASAP
jgi:hypothetical protein